MDNNKQNKFNPLGRLLGASLLLASLFFSGCLTVNSNSVDSSISIADVGAKTSQTLDSLQGVGPIVYFENRLWIGNRTTGKEGLYVYDVAKDSVLSYASVGILPPNSMGVAEDKYLVIANSDYKDGSLSTVDVTTGKITKEYKTIDSDNAISISNKKPFLMERRKAVVSGFNNGEITSSNSFLNVNTGDVSNPHNVGWVSSTKAYITRYGSSSLLIIDPSKLDGGTKDSIDLSKYVGGYGMDSASSVPHMSRITVYGNYAFVALQRLKGFAAVYTSQILVINVEKDTVTKVIDMELKNPNADFVRGKYWYLTCPDYAGEEGGIERINLETQTSDQVIVRESALEGNAMSFVATSDSEGFVVVGKTWPTNILKKITF